LVRMAAPSEFKSKLASLPNVVIHEADLADSISLASQMQGLLENYNPVAVFHCAAESSAERCELEPAYAIRINVDATREIVQACRLKSTPIFFFSTDLVFSEPPNSPGNRFTEDIAPNPRGVYPETKHQAEQEVLGYSRGYVLRTAITLGISKLFPKRGVLSGMLQTLDCLANQRQSLQDLGTENYLDAFVDEWRTPISLQQVIDSCVALLRRCEGGVIPQILNMAGKDRLSRYEIAMIVADQFGFSNELIRPTNQRCYTGLFHRPTDCSLSGKLSELALGVACLGLRDGLTNYEIQEIFRPKLGQA
jgi:dTDP-4-dehydrorhamnose reductase